MREYFDLNSPPLFVWQPLTPKLLQMVSQIIYTSAHKRPLRNHRKNQSFNTYQIGPTLDIRFISLTAFIPDNCWPNIIITDIPSGVFNIGFDNISQRVTRGMIFIASFSILISSISSCTSVVPLSHCNPTKVNAKDHKELIKTWHLNDGTLSTANVRTLDNKAGLKKY